MKKFITNNITLYILGIFLIFGVWYIISLSQGGVSFIFPGPIETFKAFFDLFRYRSTYISLLWSLLKTLLGFALSLLCALIIGFIASKFNKVQILLKPFITVLKSAPIVAFVFLFLVLITSTWAPVPIVFLVSFPILYEGVIGGLNNIPQEIINMTRIEASSKIKIWWRIKLPLSLPSIFIAIASSLGLSFKSEIMAEIITGSTKNGLGSLISAYRDMDPSNLAPIFAITMIAIIVVLMMDLLMYIIKIYFEKIY